MVMTARSGGVTSGRMCAIWTDNWENVDSERTDLPLAILFHVIWDDGREESWLRRTTGNSFRERYGTYRPPSNNVDNAL